MADRRPDPVGDALDESAESDDARTAVAEMVERTLGDRAELLDAPRVTDGIMHVLGYDTHLSRLAPDRVVAEVIRSTRILLGMLSRTTSLVIWLSDLEFADDAVFACSSTSSIGSVVGRS